MKKLLLLAVTLSIFSVNIQSQIQSTAFGGYWNDPNTWVGGIIPGAGNDVIILGPVVQGSANGYDILTEYCKNLTITSNGSLKNAEYGGGSGIFPLVVSGSVVNNGIVSDGTSDFIKIFISGDLENNNIWMPYQTEFNTSNNHNLSLSPGKSFGSKITNNGSPTITALTDMLFTCDYTSDGNLYRDNFYLNGQTFNVDNHSIELRQCLINSETLTGDFQINGNFKVDMNSADTLVFIGNIVVSDTLTCNEYGGGHAIEKLKIIGDIINNGVIMDNDGSNPDDLSILITGNITNNGVWTCNFVNLIGTDTQFISQNPGKQFDSYFSDLNANSKVQALSDITITKDFNLNGATLEMEGHTLTINGWLHNGFTNNTKLHNGYLQNLTSLDNLIIEGLVTVESNNVFQNSVIIKDTLQSKEYGGGSTIYTLLIDGDITNHGVIQNINSGDMLSLEIYGSTYNDGTWKNSFTKFAGTLHQNIHQSAGKKFVTDFSDLDSTSKIIATSDLKIEGNFDLGRSNLQMDNYEIDISGNLYNGNITSPKIKNATLSNIKTYGNVEIRGVVVIDDGNYFYGDLLVTDTLQSQVYGGGAHTYVLENFGNVENYGLIRDEPTQSENFAMYVQGNITNKGSGQIIDHINSFIRIIT